jgi:hypothetical protein
VKDKRSMPRDVPLSNIGPSASGITHCLHLLAEDAARLGLSRTHLAICQVVEICEAERQTNASPGRSRDA